MGQEDKPNFKIRFRLPSGEEFEAEGPKEFIEEQRAYFLRLTGKKPQPQPSSSPIQTPAPARQAPTSTLRSTRGSRMFQTAASIWLVQ